MAVINILSPHVADMIAAGEVVERPASVIKELMENAFDAGAKNITVELRGGGATYIRVTDDGCGMAPEDAGIAFLRHATSKLQDEKGLESIHTMGFRGEALASICAVAQVEMTTRRAEDETGTLIEIHGSDVVRQEPCVCPVGTNIKVSNLFFNVPVRRKFLKTDQTELRNLLTEFYHIVLVYPRVSFTFVHNDEILMELPSGTEKQRIEAVFGSVDEDDPSRIPYSISDRQVTRQDPAADAVLRIMGAGEEPVTVGFVLSLLAVPEIARTFGFADEDLDVISKWCIGTGIHWGLDDREVREDLADGLEGDGGQVPKLPWTFDGGISRLLEGFMQGRGERGGNYTEVEGSDAAIAGKFWHFVKCLKEVRAVFEDLGAQDCGMFSEDPDYAAAHEEAAQHADSMPDAGSAPEA